jgi:signal transduction histidine kinase
VHADRVEIADTGCGMSEAELGQVFQAFYRASGNNRGGHGVGLAIVKRLSERFGWPVEIQSQRGVGTRVTVRFPQAQAQTGSTSEAPRADGS